MLRLMLAMYLLTQPPAVPPRHEVFDMIEAGDVAGIQDLNRRGELDLNAKAMLYSLEALATPLQYALDARQPAIAVALLDAGADPNDTGPSGYPPLLIALWHHEDAVVEAMLRHGVDTSLRSPHNQTTLQAASAGGYYAIVDSLLKRGWDPNEADEAGRTSLMSASLSGEAGIVRLLLIHGADPRLTDRAGEGPLINAGRLVPFEDDGVRTTRLLLEAGASPQERSAADGMTPLHLAAANASREATILLIRAGADVEAEDAFGERPLHLAAQPRWGNDNDACEVMCALLEHGADVNAVELQGRTPLMIAAQHCNLAQVATLVAAGARVGEVSDAGARAIDFARANGCDAFDAAVANGRWVRWGLTRIRNPLWCSGGVHHWDEDADGNGNVNLGMSAGTDESLVDSLDGLEIDDVGDRVEVTPLTQ